MSEKMGWDRPVSTKLETADELFSLFSDEEKLKNFLYMDPQSAVKRENQMKDDEFCLDIPYEEIKKVVENERDRFLQCLKEHDKSQVQWEHVGSTSIKGMPGTLVPDALLIVPEFPPSRNIIQAFLDLGFYFGRTSLLDSKDLWFFKYLTEGSLKGKLMTVHTVTADNKAGKILIETRDLCRTEKWAFEDYAGAKIAAYKDASTLLDYKKGKGENSKLLQMLREKYNNN